MRRLIAVAAAGVLPLAAVACLAPITVGSHVQRTTDFAPYRTFAWDDADALPAGDRRLERNAVFKDHMYGAVERQLAVRGIALAEQGGDADLLVHYHAAVSRRLEVEPQTGRNSECTTGACADTVDDFEQSTLVLDVIDARTRQVVWRGWSEHRLDDLLANPERLARDVDRGMALILARFPRAAALPGVRREPGERP